MALIKCSECSNQVSDQAASCPQCGAPIAGAVESRRAGAPLTTVQETSKKLKAQILLSSLAFWFGVGWLFVDHNSVIRPGESDAAKWLTAIGLVWYLVTRLRIWWHHK